MTNRFAEARSIRCVLVVALLLPFASLHPTRGQDWHPVEPDAPVELFNGDDLDGWEGNTELFDAGDGVLRCTGGERGILRTEQGYTGYVLTLQWRWPEDADGRTSPGDSGIFIHVGIGPGVGDWPQCVEVQLHHQNAGDLWLLGSTLTPAEADEPQSAGRVARDPDTPENPSGQWNTLTVTCDGGYLEVLINGHTANAAYDAQRTHGPIALQCEGDAIELRDIRLEPLE